MIYIHKLLPIFILPIMLFIIFILYGLIKNKKKIVYAGLAILYIISTPLFSHYFFRKVEGSEQRKQINEIESADAIVVLSGMLGVSQVGVSNFIEWGDPDRFFGGIALIKAHKAKKLVFTGGRMPWNKAQCTEGAVLKDYSILFGIASEKIFVTGPVENTEEEAFAVRKILPESKKIILVTSAYHMFRAKVLFEREGFNIIPYKVDYKTVNINEFTFLDLLPNSNNLALSETGIRELLGRLYYYFKN